MTRLARRSASGRRGLLLVVALLTTVVAACGSDSAPPPDNSSDTARAPVVVILKDLAFNPADVTVPVGGLVEWRWEDGAIPHNVVAEDFASKTQSSGTFTHRFAAAGKFSYVCKIHPTMTGTITVTG